MSQSLTEDAITRLRSVPGVVRVATTATAYGKRPRLRIWARCYSGCPIAIIVDYSEPFVDDAAVRAALVKHLGAESAAAY